MSQLRGLTGLCFLRAHRPALLAVWKYPAWPPVSRTTIPISPLRWAQGAEGTQQASEQPRQMSPSLGTVPLNVSCSPSRRRKSSNWAQAFRPLGRAALQTLLREDKGPRGDAESTGSSHTGTGQQKPERCPIGGGGGEESPGREAPPCTDCRAPL